MYTTRKKSAVIVVKEPQGTQSLPAAAEQNNKLASANST
jgi:hypothetical protein